MSAETHAEYESSALTRPQSSPFSRETTGDESVDGRRSANES